MANVLVRMTGTIVDDEDVKANTHIYAEIPEATTLTQLVTTVTDWATAVSAVADGAWTRLEGAVKIDPAAAGLPTTPGGSEEVSETGEMQYNLNGISFTW